MTSGAPVWAREHAARLRRARIDHKKFTERMDILMTIYPPRSDRMSRSQVVPCGQCNRTMSVPLLLRASEWYAMHHEPPVGMLTATGRRHICTAYSVPYYPADASEPFFIWFPKS